MQLESLADWIALLASKGRKFQHENWAIQVFPEDDDGASFVFEQYSNSAPTGAQSFEILQYIIDPKKHKNSLLAGLIFLAEHDFSFTKITARLAQLSLDTSTESMVAELDGTRIVLMSYGAAH